MSRRRISKKRVISPDPVYNSRLVHMMTNRLMKNGKKALAYRLIYEACQRIGDLTEQDPIKVLEQAVRNATPLVEVKSRRMGGSTYQVPVEVSGFRATNLALRWIIKYSDQRVGRSMAIKLANEIIDTANDIGNTVKKKEETHKMAEANKAFAHFRY